MVPLLCLLLAGKRVDPANTFSLNPSRGHPTVATLTFNMIIATIAIFISDITRQGQQGTFPEKLKNIVHGKIRDSQNPGAFGLRSCLFAGM